MKITVVSFVLLIMFSCGKDSAEPIGPVAEFSVTSIEENKVTLTNLSTHYTSLEWDFGNDNTTNMDVDSETNPLTYTYSEAGNYTITLTVRGEEETRSSSRSVTISSVPVKVSAQLSSTSDIGSTFFNLNYTLEAEELNFTDYYLQISKANDFAALEDIDPFTGGVQEETKLNDDSTSRTVSNLIPEQQYYCRIRISVFTPGVGDEEYFSETLSVSTVALPAPIVTAETDTEPFEFGISSSLTIGDPYPVSYDIEITAARDADFTDIVSLERRPNKNVFYKEPGTGLYIKAVAMVNGKASEKTIEFNTAESFLTGNTTFNGVGADAIISNGSTVLTVGDSDGEHIIFTFANGVTEGDELEIAVGSDPGTNTAVYIKSDVTPVAYKQSPFGPITLYVYEVTETHVYFRIGSTTDVNTEMRFDDSGTDIVVKGLIAKAKIQ